jgi:hypothetical protein
MESRKGSMKTWLMCIVLLLPSFVLAADDTGWRQPGVRVWYAGITAGYSGQTDAEEANLIEQGTGTTLRVVRHSAVSFWDSPLPSSVLPVPNPTREGPFWISPARLRALHPPQAFSWNGLSLSVKARVTYQHADDLPFLALLPVQALYQAKAPRELITLTGENDGVFGDYFFDVETGLGLSSTLSMPGFYMMMMMSEINYDFAAHQAFPEDDGPHTCYRANQMAGRVEWPINEFYMFEERVVSRYGPSIRSDLTLGLHNIATGQSFQSDYYSIFDGQTRQFWITPITRAAEATASWTVNGTHGFFWVPPGDLTRDTIRVWGVDLTRRAPAGEDAVFESDQLPTDWGFTRLQLAPDGFVREMTVQSPSRSFNMDSRAASPSSKTNTITGRAYYLQTMGQAVPPATLRDLGIVKMTAPARLTLRGSPITRKVNVIVQNHAAETATIPGAAFLRLSVISLGSCPDPSATLVSPTKFPVTLAPGRKMMAAFAVTYDCANDPLANTRTATHWDYRYLAGVQGGDDDAHDDACPHDAPPGGVDPVNGKIKDKGCGGKKPDGMLGAELYTDVVVK